MNRRPVRNGLHRAALAVAFLAALALQSARAEPRGRAPGTGPAPTPGPAATPGAGSVYCAGEYADDLAALVPAARALDATQAPYTFCVRTTATYECPFYAADGTLRRTRRTVVAHGTAFAYRREDAGTLLITNDHVAEWPAVTDDEHPVEDVPRGCRRVSDALKIVHDEADDYERDDIPLSRVAVDPQLDVAVLRSRTPLPALPWKVGHSAAIREGNAVEVRGFPLGVLRARNTGKVVSAYDHDEDHDWDHDDFVIDALLSPGNSGSPVLAVSCRTGEFELVGVYHAGYARGSALNVVVGIDQIRDLMTTLKRSPHPRADGAPVALDARARTELSEALSALGTQYFPIGPLAASALLRVDGAILFSVHPREFPLRASPALVLEDLPPAADGFGALGRVFAGNRQGLRGIPRSEQDADAQGQLVRLLDALRRDALTVIRYRIAARGGTATRERFEKVARLERTARNATSGRADLAQAALDLAARLSPETSDAPISFADLLALPLAEPSPPAAQPVPASAPAPAAQPLPASTPATAAADPDPAGASAPAAHTTQAPRSPAPPPAP